MARAKKFNTETLSSNGISTCVLMHSGVNTRARRVTRNRINYEATVRGATIVANRIKSNLGTKSNVLQQCVFKSGGVVANATLIANTSKSTPGTSKAGRLSRLHFAWGSQVAVWKCILSRWRALLNNARIQSIKVELKISNMAVFELKGGATGETGKRIEVAPDETASVL